MAIMTEAVLLELLAENELAPLSKYDSPTLERLIYRGYAIIIPPRRGVDHISRVKLTEAGLLHLARLKGHRR